jgi:hypothetical protein
MALILPGSPNYKKDAYGVPLFAAQQILKQAAWFRGRIN